MEDKINKQWDEIISDIKKIKNDEDAIDNLSRKGSEKNLNLLKKKGIKIFKKDLLKLKNFQKFP